MIRCDACAKLGLATRATHRFGQMIGQIFSGHVYYLCEAHAKPARSLVDLHPLGPVPRSLEHAELS